MDRESSVLGNAAGTGGEDGGNATVPTSGAARNATGVVSSGAVGNETKGMSSVDQHCPL